MNRNKLSKKFKARLGKEGWITICPINEYRILQANDALNLGIIPSGMTEINTVIVGASGNLEGTAMFFANYCRIDDNSIDQDPYIELYENGNTQSSIHGILHHADFEGRTELLDQSQIERIAASGSTVNIQFSAKPDKPEGTLEELRSHGKIQGFNYAWEQGMLKKNND